MPRKADTLNASSHGSGQRMEVEAASSLQSSACLNIHILRFRSATTTSAWCEGTIAHQTRQSSTACRRTLLPSFLASLKLGENDSQRYFQQMNSPSLSLSTLALRPASQNKPTASSTSPAATIPPSLPLARARMPAGARSCKAYLRLTFVP